MKTNIKTPFVQERRAATLPFSPGIYLQTQRLTSVTADTSAIWLVTDNGEFAIPWIRPN